MQYIDMQKQIIKISKIIMKTKNHHIESSCIEIETICMDGQYFKNCMQKALNGKKMRLNVMKNLLKIMMKIAKKDIFLK